MDKARRTVAYRKALVHPGRTNSLRLSLIGRGKYAGRFALMENKPTREELRQRYEEAARQAIAAFPYERMDVTGEQALATWENLRATRRTLSPVVIGGDDDFTKIVDGFTPWLGLPSRKSTEEILEAAGRLR